MKMKKAYDEIGYELEKWSACFSRKNSIHILSLYDSNSVLWPTFSNICRHGSSEISNYFEKIFLLENRQVDFNSIEVIDCRGILMSSGIYTFSWEKKGLIEVVKARYSFVYGKKQSEWKIINHHSSEMPRILL